MMAEQGDETNNTAELGSRLGEAFKQICIRPINLGTPAISDPYATMLGEAAAVCFEENSHRSGVALNLAGVSTQTFAIEWQKLEAAHKSTYADLQEATEFGAYGMALVVIREVTGKTAIERSAKGGGFDWWIGDSDDPSGLPFHGKARLEVSGILRDRGGALETRLQVKKRQTDPSDSLGPAIIAIIEFGQPKAHIEVK